MIQTPMMQQLRQIRSITKNYYTLRGLQGVPCGILFLMLAVFELGWLHVPDQWINVGILAGFIGFVVVLALYQIIGNYYNRIFGRFERKKHEKLDAIIEVLGTLVLLLTGIRIDVALNPSVSATGLALALWLYICWWRTDSFRTHILVMALLTASVSLLPLTGGVTLSSEVFVPGHGGYELVFGLLLTIGGLADHLLLIRTLRRTQQGFYD